MESNADCLLLHKLPPEMRNRIYEFAVTEHEAVSISAQKAPGLPETCQQIRRECVGLFYSLNDFRATVNRVESEYEQVDIIKRRLDRIKRVNAGCVRRILIEVVLPEDMWVVLHQPNAWASLLKHFDHAGCRSDIVCYLVYEPAYKMKPRLHRKLVGVETSSVTAEVGPGLCMRIFDFLVDEYLVGAFAKAQPISLRQCAEDSQAACQWMKTQYDLVENLGSVETLTRALDTLQEEVRALKQKSSEMERECSEIKEWMKALSDDKKSDPDEGADDDGAMQDNGGKQ